MMRSLLTAIMVLVLVGGVGAVPPEETIVPLEKYTTEKGRALATTFGGELRRLYDRVTRCRPWLEVRPGGLSFSRPAGAAGDDRYLNIWVWVNQTITPEFAALSPARRASAMFSRHGVELLRQLAADAGIFADPALTGYSVILTWLKPDGRAGGAEKAETLAVFADKTTVRAFLAKRMAAAEFVRRVTMVAFDGADRLGRPPLEIWEDKFYVPTTTAREHESDQAVARPCS